MSKEESKPKRAWKWNEGFTHEIWRKLGGTKVSSSMFDDCDYRRGERDARAYISILRKGKKEALAAFKRELAR